jgi:RNA polymerase sigma factor (sigma-70 family)
MRLGGGRTPCQVCAEEELMVMTPESNGVQSMTASLAATLKEGGNDVAWARFVTKYRPEMIACCRKCGLQSADADEVTAGVLLKFLEKQLFRKYVFLNPASFRAWLTCIVRNDALSYLRKRNSHAKEGGWSVGNEEVQDGMGDVPDDRLPEAIAAEMFQRHEKDLALGQQALEIVRNLCRENEKKFRAFCLTVLEGRPGVEVGRELGMTPANVYQARHRVAEMLLREFERLRDNATNS